MFWPIQYGDGQKEAGMFHRDLCCCIHGGGLQAGGIFPERLSMISNQTEGQSCCAGVAIAASPSEATASSADAVVLFSDGIAALPFLLKVQSDLARMMTCLQD